MEIARNTQRERENSILEKCQIHLADIGRLVCRKKKEDKEDKKRRRPTGESNSGFQELARVLGNSLDLTRRSYREPSNFGRGERFSAIHFGHGCC